MKGLEPEYSFVSSRSIRGWSGPVCETLYLRHMDEATFSVKEVNGLPQTFPIADQSQALQLYLRERVGGKLRVDLRRLTALLDIPEWTRKAVKRPRVLRWLREQQEDVRDVLEAASYARTPQSGGRAHIRLPYMKLLRAAPHLQILGVMADD